MSIPPAQYAYAVSKRFLRGHILFGHALIDSHKFWKGIWGVFGAAILFCLVLNVGLFFAYTRPASQSASVSTFDPTRDPFSTKLRGENFAVVSNELYEDSLPVNFNQWSWQAQADWRSSAARHEGPYALEITFDGEGATLGVASAPIDITQYKSISLWVRPTDAVGDLYLNLYNAKGASLGKQSLSWYAPQAALTPNTWQMVRVPLPNLVRGDTPAISGFSISAEHPGVAFLDSMRLEKESVEHAPWVQAQSTGEPNRVINFAPVALPYQLAFTSEALRPWQNYFGLFALQGGALAVGPIAQTDSPGSMSAFAPGRGWGDYKVSIGIHWGDTKVFSILLRFVDDKNYVSCAFSDAGVFVQMYSVVNGKSTLLDQKLRLAGGDSISAQVQGDTVSCFVNESRALTQKAEGIAQRGTVGIETWSDSASASPHSIQTLSVSPITQE